MLLSLSFGFILLGAVTSELAESRGTHQHFVKVLAALRQSPVKILMIVAVLSRGFVFVVGLAAAILFPERPSCGRCWDNGIPFIHLFSRWDSAYYFNIALRGYTSTIGPRWGFFPGYPIVMGILGRALMAIANTPPNVAIYSMGFVVSNLAFFGSIYYLYKLSLEVLHDDSLAFYSAISLAIYPAGVFLSATYSDSLFLCLTLGSLYYWQVKKLPQCTLLGFFSALTRPVGVVLIIPYLIELVREKSLQKNLTSYLPIIIIPFGLLSFLAFSQVTSGTFYATFEAERLYWHIGPNLLSIINAAVGTIIGNPIIPVYLTIAIGGMVTSIVSRRNRAETSIDVYAIILLATYLYAPLMSFPRYSITLVPAYWGYAKWSHRARYLVIAVFLVLLAIGVGLFVNWYRFY